MLLVDLIKTETKTAEPPVETVNTDKPVNALQSTPEQETQYETVGEVNASMFSFCVEAPLHSFNGIYSKLKIRKAKKTIQDKEELEKAIERITANYQENKKVIDIEDGEYKHLKNAFTALARQKKKAEADATTMVATAIIGILIKRAEIIMD